MWNSKKTGVAHTVDRFKLITRQNKKFLSGYNFKVERSNSTIMREAR